MDGFFLSFSVLTYVVFRNVSFYFVSEENVTSLLIDDCNLDRSNTLSFRIILMQGVTFVLISALISLYINKIDRKKLLSMFIESFCLNVFLFCSNSTFDMEFFSFQFQLAGYWHAQYFLFQSHWYRISTWWLCVLWYFWAVACVAVLLAPFQLQYSQQTSGNESQTASVHYEDTKWWGKITVISRE